MNRQPNTLFAAAAIASVTAIEKNPSKIDELPKSLALTISNLIDCDREYRVAERKSRRKPAPLDAFSWINLKLINPLRLMYLISSKKCNVNEILFRVVTEGRLDLVDICRQLGAQDSTYALETAVSYRHSSIVDYCIEWGVKDTSKAMRLAIRHNNFEAIRSISKIIDDVKFDEAIEFATAIENVAAIDILRSIGRINPNIVLVSAVEHDKPESVRVALNLRASNINEAFIIACEHESRESIEILLPLVPRDVLTAGFRRVLAKIRSENARWYNNDDGDAVLTPWIRLAVYLSMNGGVDATDAGELFYTALSIGRNFDELTNLCEDISSHDALAGFEMMITRGGEILDDIDFVVNACHLIASLRDSITRDLVASKLAEFCVDRDLLFD